MDCHPVCHWPAAAPIVIHSPLVSPSLLGLPTPLYNLLSFSHGLVIALMMDAVCTSETLVNFNVTTWRYIPKTLNFNSCLYMTVWSTESSRSIKHFSMRTLLLLQLHPLQKLSVLLTFKVVNKYACTLLFVTCSMLILLGELLLPNFESSIFRSVKTWQMCSC
jgi:hypothetical protein